MTIPDDTAATLQVSPRASDRERVTMAAAGGCAALLGAWVMGQAWAPGPVFNLDLVLVERVPVPRALWGLGPDLPRRVPFGLVWSASSWLGTIGPKLLLVALFACAAIGMARLLRAHEPRVAFVAAVLFAVNPYTITRLVVGHWHVLAAMAALPWAAPLLAPSEWSFGDRGPDLDSSRSARKASGRATFGAALRGSVLLSAGGTTGGVFALGLWAVQVWRDRKIRVAGLFGLVIGQLPWLVAGALIVRGPVRLSGGSFFSTNVSGPLDSLAVLAGRGFWRVDNDVVPVLLGAALGVVLLVGLVSAVRLSLDVGADVADVAADVEADVASNGPWRDGRARLVLGLVALAVVVSSGIPGLRGVHSWVTDQTWGAPLRDSHRLLGLWLFVAVPAATAGWHHLNGRIRASSRVLVQSAAVAVVAAALASGWSGGGQLQSVDIPFEWELARIEVHERPGPVLALPWHQYYDLGVADGRRTLNVFADFLAADVLAAANPELSEVERVEAADPRLAAGRQVVDQVRDGEPVARELLDLGVRWVLVSSDIEGVAQRERLDQDLGLRRVVSGPTLALYEVEGWAYATVRPVVGLPWLRTTVGEAGFGSPTAWATVPEAGWRSGSSVANRTQFGVTFASRGLWAVQGVIMSSVFLLVGALLLLTRQDRGGTRG